jgi:hypothetical protein
MQTKVKKIGAALVAAVLALAILPAAVFWFHVPIVSLFMLGLASAGTVTVTYQTFQVPGGGYGGGYTRGTTPPTTGQAAQVQAVVALVNIADTDTVITITHNMGISTAALAALQPYVHTYLQALTGTTGPVLTYALTNSNVVTINHVSNTGTGGTYVVTVRRPWSASA